MARIVVITPRESNPALEVVSFKVRMPRYGGLAIASCLAARGHRVRFYDEFVGSRVDWNEVAAADYVCFSVLSFCARKAYAMADRVRTEFRRTVIFGGSHASVVPGDALEHADWVVRNEGEGALLGLIDALESGGDPGSGAGLSFLDRDGRVVHRPDRPFDSDLSVPIDLDLLPDFRPWGPLATLADMAREGGIPRLALPLVQATRGCPFPCRFCFVKHEQGSRYRKRPLDVVLGEIDRAIDRFRSPYLFFVDNDLLLDPQYACRLLEGLLDRHGRRLRPYLYTRLRTAANDDLLRLLEKFDRATVGVGFESISPDTLESFDKGQTVDEVMASIERFRRYRVQIDGLFLFGGDHDTPDTIPATMEFCIRQKFYNLTVNALYDFPGRRAVLGHDQMIHDHLFIHRDWRFFSGNFAVHFPRRMRPSQLQTGIIDGFTRFYEKVPETFYQFMPIRATVEAYAAYLRAVEAPYYDRNDERLDERLVGRRIDDLPRDVPISVGPMAPYIEATRFGARNLSRRISWDYLATLVGQVVVARRGR